MRAIDLKIEHLRNPIGIITDSLFISWDIDNDCTQTAFEITVTEDGRKIYDSGKIVSLQQYYLIDSLCMRSRMRGQVSVSLWDQRDELELESETAVFELGILDETEWAAKWIRVNDEVISHTEGEIIQAASENKQKLDAINLKAYEAYECGDKKDGFAPP